MTRNRSVKGDGYHHGRLRRTILDAALELVAERGVGGFSMREVARRAGVSHNAPYHHFPNKGALVEELAAESFITLKVVLREAVEAAGEDAVERLKATGIAYVRFALEDPARFRLMFRPELRTGYRAGLLSGTENDDEGEAPVQKSGREAYGVLLEAIEECQMEGSAAPGDPAPLALTAWSAVHGLSVLMLDGPDSELPRSGEEAERAAKVVTETMVRGLLPG